MKIPTIVEFLDDEKYCGGLIKLWPVQRIILKRFYGEKLTEEEIKIQGQSGYNGEEADKATDASRIEYRGISLLDDLERDELFLIAGRRSGKDYVLSLIAAYEATKLLMTNMSELRNSTKTILWLVQNIGFSKIALTQTMDKVNKCKYLREKFAKESGLSMIAPNSITFKNKENIVQIAIKNYNVGGLIGLDVHGLLCSDIAYWKRGTDRIAIVDGLNGIVNNLKALIPTKTYRGYHSGKLVVASTPKYKEGVLWEAWEGHKQFCVKAPTWVINPGIKEEDLDSSAPEFKAEFGAEFMEDTSITEQVSIRLKSKLIEAMKQEARKRSYEEARDVSYTDIMREKLEEAFSG